VARISTNIASGRKELAAVKNELQAQHRKLAIRRFLRNRLAICGAGVVIGLVFIAVFAGALTPYDPLKLDVENRLLPPGSGGHLMGTDGFGRDLFTRILYGGRISILVGSCCGLFSMAMGMALGLCAAYFRPLDSFIMRVCDGFNAIPTTLLAIALMAMLGSTVTNVILALSVVMVPRMARITRAQAVVVKEQTYIEAMRATGANSFRIILKHIAPNCLSPVVVQASYNFASAIITEASLSFLGVGIAAPTPSWGNLLNEGKALFAQDAWWMLLFPGLFLAIGVLGLNVFGDGIRDLLDPKTNAGAQ